MEKFMVGLFIIMVLAIGARIYHLFNADTYVTVQIEPINSGEKIEVTCEHEYVITSEYDWFHESYRTVSKCAKCGHVVR